MGSPPVGGSMTAALSEKVRFEWIVCPVPAFSMSLSAWPPGPTNSTATSPANPWFRVFSVTVTLLTVPFIPVTLIVDG